MAYEELSLQGFLDEIKAVSSGPHPRKFCFVLGAGASRASGIKSGQELVDIWEKELLLRNKEDYLKWKNENKITEENKYSFYSQYYEKRFKRQPMDGYNYLEKLMENAKPSIGYVMLAYLLSKKSNNAVANNVVITTNFDHLIEDAVNYYAQTMPLVIGHEALAHYVTKQLNRPTVLKIHRDLLFNPANTADEVEKLHSNWKEALDKIFSEYHPIFIGYAGNDNSVMDYLIENVKKFEEDDFCFPYWMLYKNDKLEGKVADFLDKSSGYYIKHNGFDEVLCLLGAKFGVKIPSEEEFIGGGSYRALVDAMDKFNEKHGKEVDINKDDNNSENIAHNEKSVVQPITQAFTQALAQAVNRIISDSKPNSMFREVVELTNEGKYNEALSLNKKLIELRPDNARYYATFSFVLDRLERYEEALSAIEKAIELEPNEALYYSDYSNMLFKLQRYEEALLAIEKAIELDPEEALYYLRYRGLLLKLQRYEEALLAIEKAIDLEPDDELYYLGYSEVLVGLKRYEEAFLFIQKAVELAPNDEGCKKYLEYVKKLIEENNK